MPQMPNVPTVAEGGVANYQDEPWGGLVVPAATPEAQVTRLVAVLRASVADAEIVDMINKVGGKIESSSSPAEFSNQIRDELTVDKQLVTKLGLKAE